MYHAHSCVHVVARTSSRCWPVSSFYPVNTLAFHCQYQSSKYIEFQAPCCSTLHQSLYNELLLHITETKNRWRFSLESDLLHQYLISRLQLQKYHGVVSFSLALKLFPKFNIPDPLCTGGSLISWLKFQSTPFVHHVYKGCGLDEIARPQYF